MSVLTVEGCLRQMVIWRFMFVFTLVQSRTRVDTVQTVLHGLANSRHICWSHTMKVLGWHVAIVRRSSSTVVTFRDIYVDIKVWSRMFAVSVQSVSVQQLNAYSISQFTQTSDSFAVVNVVYGSHVNILLSHISRDVSNDCHLITFNVHVYMYLLFNLRHLCCCSLVFCPSKCFCLCQTCILAHLQYCQVTK